MKTGWKISELNSDVINENSRFFKIDETIASILYRKGYKTPEEINDFINPRLSRIHNPFLMENMHSAVLRLKRAISHKEKIGIYSDSDIDGLASLTILYKLLKKFNIRPYYRYPVDSETYGLTSDIVDDFIENNIDLVITVDSGIRDVEEIKYGKEKGLDFIITDHHEPDNRLPEAIILNPKQNSCQYPFKDLAGVGVTFKFCHAFLLSYLPGYKKRFIICTNEEDYTYISYVLNGTIEKTERISIEESVSYLNSIVNEFDDDIMIIHFNADQIEKFFNGLKYHKVYNLTDLLKNSYITEKDTIKELAGKFKINNDLYKKKIDIINLIFLDIQMYSSPKIYDFIKSSLQLVALGSISDVMPLVNENRTLVYYGIKFMKYTQHRGLNFLINKETVSSKKISWNIAPLLNTPGRFGQTHLTAGFFIEEDDQRLNSILEKIKDLNEERKIFVQKIYKKLYEKISGDPEFNRQKIIFEMSHEIPDGLVGLLANRLTDTFNKPAIIVSTQNDNILVKGSGRSRGDFNFFRYVEPIAYMFDRIGGHAQAFGFTVNINKLPEIIAKLNESIGDDYNNVDFYEIDAEIKVNDIDFDFINKLSRMEPFGKGNEEPLFLSRNIKINEFARIGSDNLHGKFFLESSLSLQAIGWNMADKMEEYYKNASLINLIYKIELNEYRDKLYPQLIIIDMNQPG